MANERVAVVTGASSGIGRETAMQLARTGRTVVATVRRPDAADDLRAAATEAGVTLDVRSLEVTDPASRTELIAGVVADLGRIDILVNNAGRGMVATLEQLELQDLQAQLDVNYLGPAALTRLVLPVMRRQGEGRVVAVTSVGGVIGQPFADAYCGAKFALEGLYQSLAPVAARFGVQVCIVEPAAVASGFVGSVAGSTDHSDPDDPYAPLRAAYMRRTQTAFASAQAPADAAATVVEAATTAAPHLRWQTSEAAAAFAGLSLADLDGQRVLGVTSTWLDG